VHQDPGDAARGRHADQRGDVLLVAVHAAGRQQPEHVQRPAAVLRGGEGVAEHRVLRELAGLDRVVDAR